MINNPNYRWLAVSAALVSGLMYFSCRSQKKDQGSGAAQDQPGNLAICSDEDKSGCAAALIDGIDQTASALTIIEGNYAPPTISPATLSIETGDPAGLALKGEGPCPPDTSFAECQPYLITEYIAIARRMLDTAYQTLNRSKAFINENVNDSEGVIESDQGGIKKFQYRIDTSDKFEVIVSEGEFNIYLKIDGTAIYMISENLNEQTGPETAESKITYTDENNWNVDTHIVSPVCDRRPSIISEVMDMTGGIWYGKAMIYTVADTKTCARTPAEKSYVNYTDFIGDKMNTTASTYFLPVNFADFSKINAYGIDQVNQNFGEDVAIPRGLTDAKNPFCIDTEKKATFSLACDAPTPEVKNAAYGAADKWLKPADLINRTVSFPASL